MVDSNNFDCNCDCDDDIAGLAAYLEETATSSEAHWNRAFADTIRAALDFTATLHTLRQAAVDGEDVSGPALHAANVLDDLCNGMAMVLIEAEVPPGRGHRRRGGE